MLDSELSLCLVCIQERADALDPKLGGMVVIPKVSELAIRRLQALGMLDAGQDVVAFAVQHHAIALTVDDEHLDAVGDAMQLWPQVGGLDGQELEADDPGWSRGGSDLGESLLELMLERTVGAEGGTVVLDAHHVFRDKVVALLLILDLFRFGVEGVEVDIAAGQLGHGCAEDRLPDLDLFDLHQLVLRHSSEVGRRKQRLRDMSSHRESQQVDGRVSEMRRKVDYIETHGFEREILIPFVGDGGFADGSMVRNDDGPCSSQCFKQR